MSYYSAVNETVPATAESPVLVPPTRSIWRRADVLGPAIVLAVLLAFALTVDAVNNGYGLKGDEATYTAAAFSVAYDHDLVFERKDLERYWSIYTCGPDGIFLQKARGFYRLSAHAPFVRFVSYNDPPGDRLYFGKAFIYPLLGAPLVWLFGLNGLLVFNVLLVAGAACCGYFFLYARSGSKPASMVFTLAFLGISIVPVYIVWFTPEIFNLALLFYAYFLWLYKEVSAPDQSMAPTRARAWLNRFLYGAGSDIAAVILLGMLAFSKPLYILLPAPVFAWLLWKRRTKRLAAALTVFAVVTGGLFAANAVISGEWNYQGGNRRQFYPHNMVFKNPQATFEGGFSNATNQLHSAVFDPRAFAYRFCLNSGYFLFGRHFGLMPYFFPGFVAMFLWLARWKWIRGWQLLVLLGSIGTAALMLVVLPYTWSGGGGPPGNRYLMGVYPALFFLMPPMESLVIPALVWAGGAIFTAQLVLNPYYTAKYPYWNVEHGAVRALPIELTMVNDLPIMLDLVTRPPIRYEGDRQLLLYLLDRNAYPPEPAGLWVKGGRRADIVVRTTQPLKEMRITVSSPVANHAWLSFDGRSASVDLQPSKPMEVVIPSGGGVYADNGYGYVLSVRTSQGFVPLLVDSASRDRRLLGALLQLKSVIR